MLDRGVKVHVVADLHRHAHLDRASREQERSAPASRSRGSPSLRSSCERRSRKRRPNRASRCEQRIERGACSSSGSQQSSKSPACAVCVAIKIISRRSQRRYAAAGRRKRKRRRAGFESGNRSPPQPAPTIRDARRSYRRARSLGAEAIRSADRSVDRLGKTAASVSDERSRRASASAPSMSMRSSLHAEGRVVETKCGRFFFRYDRWSVAESTRGASAAAAIRFRNPCIMKPLAGSRCRIG